MLEGLCPLNQDIGNKRVSKASLRKGVIRGVSLGKRGYFRLTLYPAKACTACGACEKVCTQSLPIIKRLKEIVEAGCQMDVAKEDS